MKWRIIALALFATAAVMLAAAGMQWAVQ
jgi:hypothetical protein